MKQRIITAIVLLIAAIPICMFSATIVFPLVWALLGVVGVFEMLRCMGTKKYRAISIPLYIMAFVSPFVVWYNHNSLIMAFKPDYDAILVPLLFALYLLGMWVFAYEKNQDVDMNKIITSAVVSLYIIGACSSVVMIREAMGGEYYWYFIFIGAWVTDTFAYFTGMLFGNSTAESAYSLLCTGYFLISLCRLHGYEAAAHLNKWETVFGKLSEV